MLKSSNQLKFKVQIKNQFPKSPMWLLAEPKGKFSGEKNDDNISFSTIFIKIAYVRINANLKIVSGN